MECGDLGDSELIQTADIHVPTDLGDLSQVLSWFDQFNHPPVPKYIWMQCQLALAEGFTNAVRHAHQNRPPHIPIEIQVAIFSNKLEMRIWDRGLPFDLDHWFQTTPPHVDEESEGGRGLHLLQRIADELRYSQTEDQRNCLLIVKCYPHP